MRTRRLGLALVAVGVLGVVGTSLAAGSGPGSWGPGWMASMHGGMMGAAAGGEAASPVPGASQIEVVARDFSFSPAEVTLPAGTTMNLVLANQGDLLHDVTIPALGFRSVADPGARASASLTTPTPGTYEFFCSIPGHREAGMIGILLVD